MSALPIEMGAVLGLMASLISDGELSRRTFFRHLPPPDQDFALFGGQAFGQEPQFIGIDAHCHVFNAHDLPVRGFVQSVVFGDPDDTVILDPSPEASRELLPWVGALLVEFLLSGGAPSAESELREIEFGAPAFVIEAPTGPTTQQGVQACDCAPQHSVSQRRGDIL